VPFIVLAPIAALIFFITSLAENGRAPFDLLEAESEIVAGFNVEYSGLKFGFFFVGDFLHAFTIAALFSVIFLGGWTGPYADSIPILGFVYMMIKTSIMYFLGLMVRFSLPRFRIDQMMALNWKLLTPLSLATVMFTAIVDKIAPPNMMGVRVIVLILVNLIIWLTMQEIMMRRSPDVVKRVVVHHRRVEDIEAVQSDSHPAQS
jgi:NADH-quinone oxidoreductase subunit H